MNIKITETETATRNTERENAPLFPFEVAVEEWIPDVNLELISQDSYQISYTGLMIPRFPSHELKGDLKEALPLWIQQICISYGWRLEFTAIDLQYMQWGVHIMLATPPGEFMQIVRKETSVLTLKNFPRFSRENLGDDFWAEGYLVVAGIRPHPPLMIEQFIKITRRQQGILK